MGVESAGLCGACRMEDLEEQPEDSPEGSVAMDVDNSLGSRGHPDLCRRPCIYHRRVRVFFWGRGGGVVLFFFWGGGGRGSFFFFFFLGGGQKMWAGRELA